MGRIIRDHPTLDHDTMMDTMAGKGITLIAMGQVIRVPMHLQMVGHFGIENNFDP